MEYQRQKTGLDFLNSRIILIYRQCFGLGGASSSMAFADPVNQIGYCYVPNRQGYDFPDEWDLGIQKVLYEIIGQPAQSEED